MIGIDPSIISHQLHVDPDYQPIRQKRRKFTTEKNRIIDEEIQKLLQNGAVKETQFLEWLSNVVVVKKKKREMESLHRFYGFEQSLSKRFIPSATY